jgi:bacterial surface protein 26-residue repeat
MIKHKKLKSIFIVMVLIITMIGYNGKVLANEEDQEVNTYSVVAYEGEHGDSAWRIESDGTLYIGSGTLPSQVFNATASPWDNYSDEITKIVLEGEVIADGNQRYLFASLSNVEVIEGLDKLDTTNVNDMQSIFYGLTKVTELDLSNFDTTNVTNMNYMFYNMISLAELDVSNFKTSNVETMMFMFHGLSEITELNVSNFNTSNVISMLGMFQGLTKVTELDLSSFDTTNVTNMSFMFHNMRSLIKLDVSSFETSIVSNMSNMFYGVSGIIELDLSNFDTSSVINISSMFEGVSKITKLDLSSFNTSYVGNMASMFFEMDNLRELTLGNSFNFKLNALGEPQLPEVSDSFPYTGKWQHIEDESIVLSSSELMEEYDGMEMAGTYVWQRIPTYTTEVTIVGNGTAVADKTIDVLNGETVKLIATPGEGSYFKGWVVVSGDIVLNIETELEATFQNNGENVEVIAVFDDNDNSQLIDNYLYTANDFTIGISEVEGLTDELIIEKADLLVTDVLTNTQVEMEVLESNIDEVIGNYKVIFTDTNSKTNSIEIKVTIVDDVNPEITVEHEEITIEVGSELPETWDELFGVEVIDNVDTTLDIRYDVEITTIDMSVVGEYIITATVTDSSGNTSTKELTLNIVDTTAPEITVEDEEVRLEVGSELPETWSELFGVEVIDNVDTTLDIRYDVEITTIDMSVVGIYIITATVTDSSGNTSTKELTLIVEAKAINEEESETNTEETVINDNNTNNNNNNSQTTPTTGDVNNLFTMLGLLIISVSSIILVLLSKKKVLLKK